MMIEIKNTIQKIIALLELGGEDTFADELKNILSKNEESIWQYLESNEIWGGSGSIADQSLIENKELRSKLTELLIELGSYQLKEGRVNVRTESWMQTFRNWKEQGII